MSRLNTLLLLLLVACALSTVAATNRQRQLFIQLGRLQSDAHQMAQSRAELQYEQGALSKTSLIERVATEQLKMQPVTPGRTQYLVVNVAADAESGAAPDDTDGLTELQNGASGSASGGGSVAENGGVASAPNLAAGVRR
jgi:cell division protein FtsL